MHILMSEQVLFTESVRDATWSLIKSFIKSRVSGCSLVQFN